jgi:AcrR family transcriptional regulator
VAKTSSLIWERLERPSGGKPALNIVRIVQAAIRIADGEGLEAISMRRVAEELGSGTMSLYRHVSSKEDLLDLLLDAAFGEIELPEKPSRNWRSNLRLAARETRAAMKKHPWLAGLLSRRPPLGPNYLRHFEFLLASVAVLKLEMAAAVRIVGTLYVFVMGYVGFELAEEESYRRVGMSEPQRRKSVAPYMERVIATGRFPNLARFLVAGAEMPDDRGFEFGLDCVLDGIAAKVKKGSAC